MADKDLSLSRPVRETARDPVEGLLVPLAATTGLLGVLLLWARTYEGSCIALASPGLVYVAVLWGLLEYRLDRRRFAIGYYLDSTSSWRRMFRRWWLPAVTSMVVALPLAIVVSGFAALSHAADWLFLAGASLLAPLLFNGLSVWPGRHFRRAEGGGMATAPAVILTSRVAGRLLLALVVIGYVYFNYSTIARPAGIYPGSPWLTAETFAAQVRSGCPVVETGLRFAAAFDGAAVSFVTSASMADQPQDGIRLIMWAALFLNAALAMTGFVRGLEGTILLTRRAARETQVTGSRDDGDAEDRKRWAVGLRRSTLLLVPLTVLTAIGYNALQERAAERWTAEIRLAALAETRQAIDERVETAFAPVYAGIPELVDRHYSIVGPFDGLRSIFGDDKTLIGQLHGTVSGARVAAGIGVYSALPEEGATQLGRLFSSDVEALPWWLQTAYGWVLEPVLDEARRRLVNAVDRVPGGMLGATGFADFRTRASDVERLMVRSLWQLVVTNGDKEALRQAATAVVDGEKELAKAQLLKEVETVMLTPLGDFVPSRLRLASQ